MKLLIALRATNETQAKAEVEAQGKTGETLGKLVDINVTRFHPALRNINEFLRDSGYLPDVRHTKSRRDKDKILGASQDCRLYWCEIETDMPVKFWQSQKAVEAVIPRDDFNKFVLSIRYKSGAAYISACEDYAKNLPLKTSKQSAYDQPARKSKAA